MQLKSFFLYRCLTVFSALAIALSSSPSLAQNAADLKAEADRLFEQATDQLHSQQQEAAIQSWNRSQQLYQQVGEPAKAAAALGNIGIVYRGMGEYARALPIFEEVLKITQSLNDFTGQMRAYQQLGLLHRALGNGDRARAALQQQLQIARSQGNRSEEAAASGNLGLIDFDAGLYDAAIEKFQTQRRIAVELNDKPQQKNALANLGMAYEAKEQFTEALNYYEQALTLIRERNDTLAEGYLLGNIGLLYRAQKKHREALPALRAYLEAARTSRDKRGEAVALNNLGVVLYELGQTDEAIPILEEAIEVRESLRANLDDANKVSIADAQNSPYQVLQLAYADKQEIGRALEMSERSRARAFIDLLARKLSPQTALPSAPAPSLAEIQQIAREQKATLVEYSILPATDELLIWVVKPTGEVNLKRVDIKGEEGLTVSKLIPQFYDNYQIRGDGVAFKPGDFVRLRTNSLNAEPVEVTEYKPETQTVMVRRLDSPGRKPEPVPISEIIGFDETTLQKLHQILIEPIAEFLPQNPNDRVIFIPHKELFFVPFPALQARDGKYLIEGHTILTAPAIQVLQTTRRQHQRLANSPAREILIAGNPSPMPSPYQPLKFAEAEARAIANLWQTSPILGSNATKSALLARMPQARIVHLATHGQLDEASGLNSAIILAASGGDRGLLTASEILNLSLNAELVVLSACETGKGRLTGDGVIGLSRSLIAAGTPSVIVSLWKVNDESTSRLMEAFHRQLQQNPDKARALRQAMLSAMQQNPHPQAWAAFTLIGEAD